jgi:hypothetical protein
LLVQKAAIQVGALDISSHHQRQVTPGILLQTLPRKQPGRGAHDGRILFQG